MKDAAAPCLFFGSAVPGTTALGDLIDVPGGAALLVSDLAAAVLRQVVADCARGAWPVPTCLHALALEVERAADRNGWWPATLVAPVPICVQNEDGEPVEAAEADFVGASALAKLLRPLRSRIFGDTGASAFREGCGCATCLRLRDPDGFAAMLGSDADPQAWHDDLPPEDRPPVPLAEVSMPLAAFVATLHPDQQVISPDDGKVVRAQDFARKKRVPVNDESGKPRLKRNGETLERWAVSGLAYLRNGAQVAYPGAGALAQAALPRPDPFGRQHDFQRCRWDAIQAGRLDPASETCPCGIGARNAVRHSERCLICGDHTWLPPSLAGEDRPLVALCENCDADLEEATAPPGAWRYIAQPGNGLESLIGPVFHSECLIPSGETVYSVEFVRPGYIPLVLAILPPDLIVAGRGGRLATVEQRRAEIVETRRAAANKKQAPAR